MKQEETIAVRAERIVKEARHNLEMHPNPQYHGFDFERFWHKKVLIGLHYLVYRNGEEILIISVCREGEVEGVQPYYYACELKDGEIIKKGFYQQTWCLDTDFSHHDNLVLEIFEEAIPYVLDRSNYPKKNS